MHSKCPPHKLWTFLWHDQTVKMKRLWTNKYYFSFWPFSLPQLSITTWEAAFRLKLYSSFKIFFFFFFFIPSKAFPLPAKNERWLFHGSQYRPTNEQQDLSGGSAIKILPTMQVLQEIWVLSLSWEDPLEWCIATHSNILAWRISLTEEPGGLQSTASQRVSCNWLTDNFTLLSLFCD